MMRIWMLVVFSVLLGAALGLTSEISINFQKDCEKSCAEDVLVDCGKAYGPRSEGLKYGWLSVSSGEEISVIEYAEDRGSSSDDSCLFRTFIQMQPQSGTDDYAWQIELPNQDYIVTVLCGEPVEIDSVHAIDANGVTVIGATEPTALMPEVLGSRVVSVTNGVLLLSPILGTNTKISHVKIEPVENGTGCVPFPSQFNGQAISTLPCEEVKKSKFNLSFDSDAGGIVDGFGVGTGFTMWLPSSKGIDSYQPQWLEVKDGSLYIETKWGRMNTLKNKAVNNLGVGLNLPDADLRISGTYILPDITMVSWERACLYFGISDTSYITVCFLGHKDGPRVFAHYEVNDVKTGRAFHDIDLTPSREITLSIELFPLLDEVRLYCTVGNGQKLEVASFVTGAEMFTKDAAGTDINLKTRSFAGIYASHAWRGEKVKFQLTDFTVEEMPRSSTQEVESDVDFDEWYIDNVQGPTAMRYGPDGKLYVAHVTGEVSVITLDYAGKKEVPNTRVTHNFLGNRLLLGLEIDPKSTSDNVILWLSHSDGSQHNGQANSGKVTKASGDKFENVEDIIIGLPRAMANHGPNQLRFNKGKLYIAVGGNTAGGTPNAYNSDFGFRPEQCLSAAILRADVRNPDFNGDCTPRQNPDEMDASGIAFDCDRDLTCDVEVHASGTRNPFDMEFYNGHLYATDNGVGGLGTAPNIGDDYVSGDSCHGPVMDPEDIENLDPKKRVDMLLDVKRGDHFGHPNPAKGNCVYYGGNPTSNKDFLIDTLGFGEQVSMEFRKYPVGTQADPNYKTPMFSLGVSHSANGIIAYRSDVFCGRMVGDLLVTFYSQEDQIHRLELNTAGTSVVSHSTLIKSSLETGAEKKLRNPLCMEQDSHGNIFIGEFFGNRIKVMDPIGGNCSRRLIKKDSSTRGPAGLIHSAVTESSTKIFVFGGSREDASVSAEAHEFDSYAKKWKNLPPLPFALEGSGAARMADGSILIFGGKKSDGSVSSEVLMFDPMLATYEVVSHMPAARAFMSILPMQNGKLVVAGGIDDKLEATGSTFEFDFENSSWTKLEDMKTKRYGAAHVADDGNSATVCGGLDEKLGALSNCEVIESGSSSWAGIPSMPTARGFSGAVAVDAKLIVKGGESTDGTVLDTVEEYDPATGKWTTLKSMSTARSRGRSSRIGSAIINFGGRVNTTAAAEEEVFYYK